MQKLWSEVCVIGGGPAGSAAAIRLAQCGHSVCLVEQAEFPRAHVGESLSPGVWPVLESLGVREEVAIGARFPSGTLLRWSGSETFRRNDQWPSGGLVDRGEFDVALLSHARSWGVQVIQPARASARRLPDGWEVHAIGAEVTQVSCAWLVDGSGRLGCMERRRSRFSPSTLALWLRLRETASGNARIEARPDGWLWAAPIGDGVTSLLYCCDPSAWKQRETRGTESALREVLTNSDLFKSFSRYPAIEPVRVMDASCSYALSSIGPGYVKVGEASFAIDPLSSCGIEKALQSAVVGAIAAHTLLKHPGRSGLCRRMMQKRVEEAVAQHAEWSGSYYGEVGIHADRPFWASRSRNLLRSPPIRPLRADLPKRETRVCLSLTARWTEEPCITGNEISSRAAVHTESLPRPVAYVEGVEIAPLLQALPSEIEVGALVSRWTGELSSFKAGRIAAWLWYHRIIHEVHFPAGAEVHP
jgi:flavin-dependent dehydrogenase